MCAMNRVWGPDGKMQFEHETKNFRYNPSTGEVTRYLGKPGVNGRMVLRPNGSVGFEREFCGIRQSADTGQTFKKL